MTESELGQLLRLLNPVLAEKEFVFVNFEDGTTEDVDPQATVREPEGLSAVVTRDEADRLGLEYDFVAAWITLSVESDLAAVGLTSAVSSRLAENGISCNVIAGLRHDHLLVPEDQAAAALEALIELSKGGPPG